MSNIETKIAIVDDEADVRAALSQMFSLEHLPTIEFCDAESTLAAIDANFPGIVISDLRMPGMDGHGLFNRLRQIDPELPVIILSGHGDLASAVDLVKRGAYDFLAKPFDGESLLAAARRALEKRSLVLENRRLRQQALAPERDVFVGDSPQIEQFRQTLAQLASADIDVLISGESGTGKSLAASTLHRRSPRGRMAMIVVDCGALLGDHAESLLFGHVSGAFPGAQFPRTGQLARADGSTLFLDHVDGLAAPLQARILQSLEDHAVLPMGSNQAMPSHFRTISASRADMQSQIAKGAFDQSLYFRLSGFHLEVPPLRMRKGDVILLFRSFLADASAELKREPPLLSPAVWRKLRDHDWPGNVRELKSFAANVALGLGDAQPMPQGQSALVPSGLKDAVAAFEADLIRKTLAETSGDIAAALTRLNLPRKTLYDKLARHDIDPDDYRSGKARRAKFNA